MDRKWMEKIDAVREEGTARGSLSFTTGSALRILQAID
jgi:hypothetical protein